MAKKFADNLIDALDPRALQRILAKRLLQAAEEHEALERAAQIIDAVIPALLKSGGLHPTTRAALLRHYQWIEKCRKVGQFPGPKRPVGLPKREKVGTRQGDLCPGWGHCSCVAQGYVNDQEYGRCGRKPKAKRKPYRDPGAFSKDVGDQGYSAIKGTRK